MQSDEDKDSCLIIRDPPFSLPSLRPPIDWLALGEKIKGKVFGQDHVIDGLLAQLKRRHAMSQSKNTMKTLALFLFAGPRGVGKTYLSKTLSENVYDGKGKIHWVDMAQCDGSHSLAGLLGTPVGNVGGEGSLTGALAKNPKLVILLDDFERAHEAVQKTFLKGWLDGYFTDCRTGRKESVNQAIFLVTTGQAGNRLVEIEQTLKDDCHARNLAISEALKDKGLPMELVGMMDQTFIFLPLDWKALAQVAFNEIVRLAGMYKLLVVKIDSEYLGALVSDETVKEGDVRSLVRIVEGQLGDQMAGLEAMGAKKITVAFIEGKPVVQIVEDRAEQSAS
jgi:ATP-dependent Clp protease ATP-binding subunit ClpA